MATHYELLGVRAGASTDEIQKAYRLLARRHHPDVAPEADRSTMAAINRAWEVLNDPARRRTYDAQRRAPAQPPPPRTARPAPEWEHPYSEDPGPGDLDDQPYAPVQRKPADLLVMTPVLLVAVSVAVFFFGVMSGSNGPRTISILLLPVSALGFVAAPLFVMLRSRSRSGH